MASVPRTSVSRAISATGTPNANDPVLLNNTSSWRVGGPLGMRIVARQTNTPSKNDQAAPAE